MDSYEVRELTLVQLENGLPGITHSFGGFMAQAGAICFDCQGHRNGVELRVDGTFRARYKVYWQEVTDQVRRSWRDLQEATEYAAYGVSILLILDLTQYTVIERSYKGTGFDYWLGEKGDMLFQAAARLEATGILRGSDSIVHGRLKAKRKQVKQSDALLLPVFIVVVEFSTPLSHMVKQ